jgi:hypothetical protein
MFQHEGALSITVGPLRTAIWSYLALGIIELSFNNNVTEIRIRWAAYNTPNFRSTRENHCKTLIGSRRFGMSLDV